MDHGNQQLNAAGGGVTEERRPQGADMQLGEISVSDRGRFKRSDTFCASLGARQFEHDCRFDSTKVERALGLTATEYREEIAATVNSNAA